MFLNGNTVATADGLVARGHYQQLRMKPIADPGVFLDELDAGIDQ